MRTLFILLLSLASSIAYKMVVITPTVTNSQVTSPILVLDYSQVMFGKRVAEALAEAGHDVTIAIFYSMEEQDTSNVKISKNVKSNLNVFEPKRFSVYNVNATSGFSQKEEEEQHAEIMFEDISMWDSKMRAIFSRTAETRQLSCLSGHLLMTF